ncbi:MAG TPA: sulfatase-like hydrolase/transferase [Tepidisphaeraceae bacterium]|nr:sulfatase-like hydrolase/transferase [Tepidisphaeraceae bacterium]
MTRQNTDINIILDEPAREQPNRSIFWPFFCLALACFISKVHYLNTLANFFESNRRLDWLQQLAAITQRDAAFVILSAMAAAVLLAITRPLKFLNKWLYRLTRLFALLCLIYLILATAAFDFLRSFPTCSLWYQAGGWRAPLWDLLTRELEIVLAASIISYIILVAIFNRLLRPKRPWAILLSSALLLAALFCWYRFANIQIDHFYRNRHDIRIADNPHWIILRSAARSWSNNQWGHERPIFQEADLTDFAIASDRPDKGAPTAALARGPTNVIVICLESVATRYLSLYGSEYPTTSSLLAESHHALVFDRFYSHVTNSGNSLFPMLLAIYPPMSWREAALSRPDYPATSIANILHARGYRTAFISASTTEYANGQKFLASRGFDLIEDYRDSGCTPLSDWGVADRCMIDMMLRFIDKPGPKQPFFIFGWSNQTHWPYEPSPGQTEIDFLKADKSYGNMSWDLGRYLNALHEADAQIGRLISELRRRNLADSTLLIITGDHGEGMGKPHPFYGHSGKLYQEDVNVPLIIWSPALFKSPSRSDVIGAHVDLSPTILDFLNLPFPPSWQGHSLMSPSHPHRAYFYGSADEYLLGVRDGPLKYILNATRDSDELYDLPKDPTEQNNIAHESPQQTNRLRQRTAAWLRSQFNRQ